MDRSPVSPPKTTSIWRQLLTVAILVAAALSVFCLLAVVLMMGDGHGESPKTTCANNLRQMGTILVANAYGGTEGRQSGWPSESGAAFLLQLYFTSSETEADPRVFVCRADEKRRSLARAEPDKHRPLFEGLTRRKLADGEWPDGLTSYAGRNQRDYPLSRPSKLYRPIACDAAAYHDDGVNVLYEDGKVEFLTWKQLGIESTDEFHFGYGPKGCGGPGPLEALCIRLK